MISNFASHETQQEIPAPKRRPASRTRAIAFIGLSVALIALSAWVTIPIGPVPITLQMFMIPLLIYVLPPTWASAAAIFYVALGAIGVPVFSGFRGGIGAIAGPTGGFLLAYILAIPIAAFLLSALRKRILKTRALRKESMRAPAREAFFDNATANKAPSDNAVKGELAVGELDARKFATSKFSGNKLSANMACEILSGIIFTLIAYIGGWAWYCMVVGVTAEIGFAVAVAPFIIPDLAKIIVAAFVARAVPKTLIN